MESIVKKYKDKCPFLLNAWKSNLIKLKTFDLIKVGIHKQEEMIFKIISEQSDIILKCMLKEKINKVYVSTIINLKNIRIKEFEYNRSLYYNKLIYKKAPLVYGKVYAKKVDIYIIVIRPYLGEKDDKFFIKYPSLKYGKLECFDLNGNNIEELLKYDDILNSENYYTRLKYQHDIANF